MKKVVLTNLSLNVEKISDLENAKTKGGATRPGSCLALGCTGSGHWICPSVGVNCSNNPGCGPKTLVDNTEMVCC